MVGNGAPIGRDSGRGRPTAMLPCKIGCVTLAVASCPWVDPPYFGLKVEAV